MAKTKDKSAKTGKSTKPGKSTSAPAFSLTAFSGAIDPSLASLFGSSRVSQLGPVKAPQKTYTSFVAKQATAHEDEDDTSTVGDESDKAKDGTSGSGHERQSARRTQSATTSTAPKVLTTPQQDGDRRAKRKRVDDDLEERYMRKLQEEEDTENHKLDEARKAKKKASEDAKAAVTEKTDDEEEQSSSGSEQDDEDDDDGEDAESGGEEPESCHEHESQNEGVSVATDNKKGTNTTKLEKTPESFPILHESLQTKKNEDLEEAERTVFLGNIPSIVISSKAAYKTLKSAFSVAGKISKIRFRSVAFSEQIPRKAAFALHKLHEKQQTANAYVVYQTKESARAALKLNGTTVLDRHIRVDSVAHPAKHDAQRSVFIGNLDFEAQEENLWRHFANCGKIEYVRVVRDGATNVGKGFAYVQFENGTSVEQALVLDGQKMQGDRKLRVSRAKNIRRKNKPSNSATTRGPPPSKKQKTTYVPKDDPRQKEMLGRARKLLGKAGAAKMRKAPEAFIFEGTRATATSNPGVKLGGKKYKGKKAGGAKPNARSTAWKQKNKK